MKPLTKLILTLVIGLAVTFGSGFYLIKPTLQKINQMNADLRNKKSEVKTLEQQIVAFTTAQSDLSKATEKERIAASIVSKYDLVKSIKSMEDASLATGTTQELSIQDPYLLKDKAAKPSQIISGKQGIDEVPYVLTVQNEFLGLVYYLQYLEHLPYFTELTKLELSGGVVETTEKGVRPAHTGRVDAKIEGVLFITKDEGTQAN